MVFGRTLRWAAVVAWVVLSCVAHLQAQNLSIAPPTAALKHPTLPTLLRELEVARQSGTFTRKELERRCENSRLPLRADEKVLVEIIGPVGATAVPSTLCEAFTVDVVRTWRHVSKVWVPLSEATSFADALPPGYAIHLLGQASLDDVAGEGPQRTRTDDYRDAGVDGTGVTVGVIDSGFRLLGSSQAAGDSPTGSAVTITDYTPDPTTTTTEGSRHGTGCLENVYDHAPGASYRLYKIDTGSLADFGAAVDDCIANGVDVITHSVSWYNWGWHDDTGPCASANEAGAAGILVFTSAGNRAKQHWQGTFSDGDADNWHNFAGTDESVDVLVGNGVAVRFYLQWNTDPGVVDHDLFLFDTAGSIIASSTNGGEQFELVDYFNDTGSAVTIRAQVSRLSGPTTDMEIFMLQSPGTARWLQHQVATGSTTSPSNATHPNVISVAAVDQSDFDSPSGTSGIARDYSSRGPTNDGLLVPDLSGPTNTRGTAYSTFGGTSCATPNAAGVAAVALSCTTSPTAAQVREQLFDWADCLKDWGPFSKNTTYGFGGINLPELQDCWSTPGTPDACEIIAGEVNDMDCDGVADSLSCGDLGITLEIPGILAGYSPISGVSVFTAPVRVRDPWNNPGFGTPYQGFSLAVAHDPAVIMPISLQAGPDLFALGGGQGPEFFGPTILPEGVILGVVFDFNGLEFLSFEEPRTLALLEYEGNANLLTGNSNGLETELSFDDGLGDPPIENALIAEGGIEILPDVVNGLVEVLPLPDFKFTLGESGVESETEITIQYDPTTGVPVTGLLTLLPAVQQIGPGPEIPTAGFRMQIEYDANLLEVADVSPADALAGINGGNGPEIFEVELSPGNFTVEVQYGGQETLAFPIAVEMLKVNFLVLPAVQYEYTRPCYGFNPIWTTVVLPSNQNSDPMTAKATILYEATLPAPEFVRGDLNGDQNLGLPDAITLLNFLFVANSPTPGCLDTADINDDGGLGLVDGILLLNHLFLAGPQPEPPTVCGVDPTDDNLSCEETGCP